MGYKTICKACKKYKYITARGLCVECGMNKVKEAQLDIKKRQGPGWEKYKRGMEKYLYGPKLITGGKQCPACLQGNKMSAKKCIVCKFVFRDYSKGQ